MMEKLKTQNYEIANGSSFSGLYLNMSLKELIKHFGKASYPGSGDNKVQLTWVFYCKLINGKIEAITIYDWKCYDQSINEIKTWHVGSKNLTTKEVFEILTDEMRLYPQFIERDKNYKIE